MAKFIGFVVFVIVATAAFFVPISLGTIAPIALKPKNDEDKEEEIEEL